MDLEEGNKDELEFREVKCEGVESRKFIKVLDRTSEVDRSSSQTQRIPD